jgi:hypothetical protein
MMEIVRAKINDGDNSNDVGNSNNLLKNKATAATTSTQRKRKIKQNAMDDDRDDGIDEKNT